MTELTIQLSKSMLHTKCDSLNFKMQKMSENVIKVTSSLSCNQKIFFIFQKLQQRHVCKNFDLHNTSNRFYDKILLLEHLKNVTPWF